ATVEDITRVLQTQRRDVVTHLALRLRDACATLLVDHADLLARPVHARRPPLDESIMPIRGNRRGAAAAWRDSAAVDTRQSPLRPVDDAGDIEAPVGHVHPGWGVRSEERRVGKERR